MMSQYEFVEDLDRAQFRSLIEDQRVKTHFLGSWEWGQVCAKRGWTPYYVGAKKDGALAATALLLQKKLFFGFSYFYIPRGFTMDYGDQGLLEFMTQSVHKFCKKHHSIYFKIDPDIKLHTIDIEGNVIEGEDNETLVKTLESMGYMHKPLNYYFENEQPRFTFRIPLSGTIDEIESRYSRTTKARIKTAQNSEVEVFTGNAGDIPEFVRLMEMTEKRQDFYSHDKEYYTYFYDIFSESDMVTLYFGKINVPKLTAKLKKEQQQIQDERAGLEEAVSKKAVNRKKEIDKKLAALSQQLEGLAGKPQREVIVSAYLTVRYGDKSWALYAANDMEYGRFFANYLVYQRQIRDAYAQGQRIFDVFGTIGKPGSDSRLAGLYEFKKKWGGEYTEFIGEFDYVENRLMYFFYKKLIPIYHRAVNKRLREQVREDGNREQAREAGD